MPSSTVIAPTEQLFPTRRLLILLADDQHSDDGMWIRRYGGNAFFFRVV
ncbi:MAG: hypothetical protein U9Q68_01820 [Euryarchaeota archaeon]|nr:hypothetical protein [Euryarchaeota archaeon]